MSEPVDLLATFDIETKIPIILVDGSSSNNNNNNQCKKEEPTLELPKPSFRKLEPKPYMKRAYKLDKKDGYYYYHHQPIDEDEVFEQIEYDIDDADINWLTEHNSMQFKPSFKISERDFEKIMDRLEKLSYFQKGTALEKVNESEAVCSVCDGEERDGNMIIFCDLCDLPVHQECYGVPYVPEDLWFCKRCLMSPSKNVHCELCPNMGGAFKFTDNNKWAHVLCAIWIPEVSFGNAVFMEPIERVNEALVARKKLTCYICKQKKNGACIQCHNEGCYEPFHVTCAREAKLCMKINPSPYGFIKESIMEAYCGAHSTEAKKKTKKIKLETNGHSDGAGLNGVCEDLASPVLKRRRKYQDKKMKQVREILAQKREQAPESTANPTVNEESLIELSKLLIKRGAKSEHIIKTASQSIKDVYKYWLDKRAKQNGVPLLRNLQSSLRIVDPTPDNSPRMEESNFKKVLDLKVNLDKVRLAIDMVKKRETYKKEMFRLGKEIIDIMYQEIDREAPPSED